MLEPLFLKITKRGVPIVSNGVTKFAFMNSLLPCINPKNAFTLGHGFILRGPYDWHYMPRNANSIGSIKNQNPSNSQNTQIS